MVSINDISQILKTTIPSLELSKLSAKNSSLESAVKIIAGNKFGANVEELNLAILKNYLPDKVPLAKSLADLMRILSSTSKADLPPQAKEALINIIKSLILSGKDIDENVLKKVISKTGLNYEADLKKILLSKTGVDIPQIKGEAFKGGQFSTRQKRFPASSIKGQLLKMAQEIEVKLKNLSQTENRPQINELQSILKNIRTTLSNIELNQVLNYFSKQDDGSLLIQIPFSASETIQLYVKDNSKKNKQKDNKKDDVSLAFLLDLEKMGNIKIDVRLVDESICCNFFAEDKGTVEFIDSMLPELESKLEKTYNSVDLSSTQKDYKFFEEEKPEKKLFNKKTQIISVKA